MCVLGSVKGIKVNSKVGKGEEKKSGVSGSSANIYIERELCSKVQLGLYICYSVFCIVLGNLIIGNSLNIFRKKKFVQRQNFIKRINLIIKGNKYETYC